MFIKLFSVGCDWSSFFMYFGLNVPVLSTFEHFEHSTWFVLQWFFSKEFSAALPAQSGNPGCVFMTKLSHFVPVPALIMARFQSLRSCRLTQILKSLACPYCRVWNLVLESFGKFWKVSCCLGIFWAAWTGLIPTLLEESPGWWWRNWPALAGTAGN